RSRALQWITRARKRIETQADAVGDYAIRALERGVGELPESESCVVVGVGTRETVRVERRGQLVDRCTASETAECRAAHDGVGIDEKPAKHGASLRTRGGAVG